MRVVIPKLQLLLPLRSRPRHAVPITMPLNRFVEACSRFRRCRPLFLNLVRSELLLFLGGVRRLLLRIKNAGDGLVRFEFGEEMMHKCGHRCVIRHAVNRLYVCRFIKTNPFITRMGIL